MEKKRFQCNINSWIVLESPRRPVALEYQIYLHYPHHLGRNKKLIHTNLRSFEIFIWGENTISEKSCNSLFCLCCSFMGLFCLQSVSIQSNRSNAASIVPLNCWIAVSTYCISACKIIITSIVIIISLFVFSWQKQFIGMILQSVRFCPWTKGGPVHARPLPAALS